MTQHPNVAAKLRDRAALPAAELRRYYNVIGLLLILFATFLVYLPALRGGVLSDDEGHITKPELQSLSGLSRIWFEMGATQQYYPLLHTAFWLEHNLWAHYQTELQRAVEAATSASPPKNASEQKKVQ